MPTKRGRRNTPQASTAHQGTSVYEAGSQKRRLAGWFAPTTTANSGVIGNLTSLRNRSRSEDRNDGLAGSIIDKHVVNLIGTGIRPMSKAKDKGLRRELQDLFNIWTDECDADGLLDFYGMESQATRGWLTAGEMFVRARARLKSDGLSVPLQIQNIEPELCPHTYTTMAPNGNRVRAGIEFNKIGRRVAFWFHPSRPELDDFDSGDYRRVPIEAARQLFEPTRAGQIRGIPVLTRALVHLFEVKKMNDTKVIREQLSNMFVAYLKRSATSADQNDINPLTGLQKTSTRERDTLRLEPGIFQELEADESVEYSKPPEPGPGFIEFMRMQMRLAAIAGRIPYEVATGDLTGLNDRTLRVTLNEVRRAWMMWQHQIIAFQYCQFIWNVWCDTVFYTGIIKMPSDYMDNPIKRLDYAAVSWVPQGWPYLHPVQDVEASMAAVRDGFQSRSRVVSEQGEDAEVIDEENAADNARSDDLKLKYDSDGRNTVNGKSTAPIPMPNPTTDD